MMRKVVCLLVGVPSVRPAPSFLPPPGPGLPPLAIPMSSPREPPPVVINVVSETTSLLFDSKRWDISLRIAPQAAYCHWAVRYTEPSYCLCHSPDPRSWTLACSHTAIHSSYLPFNGLHPVIHIITWITTYLLTLKRWKAELADS